MRLVIGMTGASGAPLTIALLAALQAIEHVETHFIMSEWACSTLKQESAYSMAEILALADVVYDCKDQGAAIASGSFQTEGMIIIPCSMKTVAGIRVGYTDTLIGRAADVMLKERHKLVLVPREMPLSTLHLENLLALSHLGVVIIPPMLTFYHLPQNIDDMVQHLIMRILDQFGLPTIIQSRWHGID